MQVLDNRANGEPVEGATVLINSSDVPDVYYELLTNSEGICTIQLVEGEWHIEPFKEGVGRDSSFGSDWFDRDCTITFYLN